MCNSWPFCKYQTLWKNLTKNEINQIKNSTKLTLKLLCLKMALSYNNNKKNTITKKIVM